MIVEVLRSRGMGTVVDISTVRERPWGTVLRVTTASAAVYFKAEGLGAACEPAVLRVLGRKCPELLPDVLAGNEERGWLLLADHGTPLWTGVLPRHQVAEFERLLPAYARLQASTVDSVDELLANGVPTGPTACPPWSSRSWPT